MPQAHALLAQRAQLLQSVSAAISALHRVRALKTRMHGDYHLGQVLLMRNDFVIVDFEGEPARPLAERREKQSPLRDVAGMLRSFAYARRAALRARPRRQSLEDCAPNGRRCSRTGSTACASCSSASMTRSRAPASCTSPLPRCSRCSSLFEIDKALYELRYELGNRPDWASIPLRALHRHERLTARSDDAPMDQPILRRRR